MNQAEAKKMNGYLQLSFEGEDLDKLNTYIVQKYAGGDKSKMQDYDLMEIYNMGAKYVVITYKDGCALKGTVADKEGIDNDLKEAFGKIT